jgi:signal transduction histidine kinase
MDTDQMTQVFLNILLNAIEASPRGGRVFIRRTNQENGRLVVAVEDTGEGIPRENLDKLFDPFFSTKKKGTGLGLPIVKSIVEGHDGEIEVESEPGKGTRIIVTLRTYQISDELPEKAESQVGRSVGVTHG